MITPQTQPLTQSFKYDNQMDKRYGVYSFLRESMYTRKWGEIEKKDKSNYRSNLIPFFL